jgi:hypothetical protein
LRKLGGEIVRACAPTDLATPKFNLEVRGTEHRSSFPKENEDAKPVKGEPAMNSDQASCASLGQDGLRFLSELYVQLRTELVKRRNRGDMEIIDPMIDRARSKN